MRIGGVFEWKTNAHYRTFGPLDALGRRGHDIALARDGEGGEAGRFRPELLRGRQVIHGYRMLEPEEVRAVRRQIQRGAAFVWDTDDDLEALPPESPFYRSNGGRAAKQLFARTVELARMADIVTTSSEQLADRYRDDVERVEVIGNYLLPSSFGARGGSSGDGVVIGWVAGLEHGSELTRIPIEAALVRLAQGRPEVRIETIGLRLDLPADRYTYVSKIEWGDLQRYMAGWGIGIAPLADIPFNRARSDVKLKEYGSVGLPWLASAMGPYAGLGEREGGRLVADDGWFDALDALAGSGRDRRRLGKRAGKWAKSQSIDRHVGRLEAVLEEAIARRAARGAGRLV